MRSVVEKRILKYESLMVVLASREGDMFRCRAYGREFLVPEAALLPAGQVVHQPLQPPVEAIVQELIAKLGRRVAFDRHLIKMVREVAEDNQD